MHRRWSETPVELWHANACICSAQLPQPANWPQNLHHPHHLTSHGINPVYLLVTLMCGRKRTTRKCPRPTPPPRVVLNSCGSGHSQRWPLLIQIPPKMGTVGLYGSFSHHPRLKVPILKTIIVRASTAPSQVEFSRRHVLERVDEELAKGNERAALALVKDSQGKPGGLRCFGSARQVPQRLYTLDELKLNGIKTASLLSPVDATLGAIERNLQLAAVAGGFSAWNLLGLSPQQIFFVSLALLFLWTFDSHEAGHFLIAYLVGILPRGYTISSLEALKKEGSLNVQAGTSFVDFEFLEEVNVGRVSATMLNRFSCIALAGVATEYLLFGCAEGGLADINKLDILLKGLGFTQKKADSQVRWSVLNTVLLLRRHNMARGELAKAMSQGKSVGFCIDVLEDTIGNADI